MIQILRKNFDANPGRSTIVLNGKCSDCGCDTIIEITPTSGGFGLQGGALYKCSPDGYFAKCPECFKAGQHENKLEKKKLTQQSIKKSKWLKEKNCKKKINEELNKYSEAFTAIEKFYSDVSEGKLSEKDFPHDHAKNALETHKIIIELIDQLKKLGKG